MSKYINQYSNYAAYSGDSSNFNYPHAAYLNEEGIGVYDRDNRRFCDVFGTVVDGTQEGDFGIYINDEKRDVELDGNKFYYKKDFEGTITKVKFYNVMGSATKKIKTIDKFAIDTSNITDMSYMFQLGNQYNPSNATYIDLSNINTSNVTNMSDMFSGCQSLTSIDVSNFNTSGVTNINGIFSGCRSLTSLDLSNFNTSNVTFMREVFSDCTSLITIDISNWDTTKAAGHPSYYSYMFNNCSSLGSITMNNTSQSTLEFIEARLVDAGIASNVTIHRDGYAWTYVNNQWVSTPE